MAACAACAKAEVNSSLAASFSGVNSATVALSAFKLSRKFSHHSLARRPRMGAVMASNSETAEPSGGIRKLISTLMALAAATL